LHALRSIKIDHTKKASLDKRGNTLEGQNRMNRESFTFFEASRIAYFLARKFSLPENFLFARCLKMNGKPVELSLKAFKQA